MMEAKDEPLTEEERRERERAREVGRQMAKDTMRKLKPQIKAIADVINSANDRIYGDGRKAGIREVMEWGDEPCGNPKHLLPLLKKRNCIECWHAKRKKWGIE